MYWEPKRRIQQKKYYMTLSINYLTNQEKRRRISLEHIIYYNIPHWLGLIRLVLSIHSNGLSALYIQQDIHRDCSAPMLCIIIICACCVYLLLLLFKWVVLILNWKEEEDDEEQERSYIMYRVCLPCHAPVLTRAKKKIFKFLNCSFLLCIYLQSSIDMSWRCMMKPHHHS